jgi:hypothetical protein
MSSSVKSLHSTANSTKSSFPNNTTNNQSLNELVKIAKSIKLDDPSSNTNSSKRSSVVNVSSGNGGELVKIASYDPVNDDLVLDTSVDTKKDFIHKENDEDGTISLNLDLPSNIDPTNINIVLSDKKILIKSKLTDDILYVIALPENTDFRELEYSLEKIEASPSL